MNKVVVINSVDQQGAPLPLTPVITFDPRPANISLKHPNVLNPRFYTGSDPVCVPVRVFDPFHGSV